MDNNPRRLGIDSFAFVGRGGTALSSDRRARGLVMTFLIFTISEAFEVGMVGKALVDGGVEGSGFAGDGEAGRSLAGAGGERSASTGEGIAGGASVPDISVTLEIGSFGAEISRSASGLSEGRCNSRMSNGKTGPPD